MKTLRFIAPTLVLASAAQAALLLQENFDSLNTGGLGGQSGWTADATLTVAAGGLSYNNGDINISGGANHSTWSNANLQPIGAKTFASQSGDVWFSLTLNVDVTNTSNRFWFYVGDDGDLSNSGLVGQMNSNSQALLGGVRIGSTQTATSTGSSFASGTGSILDTTLFIVGRYSKSANGSGTATSGDYDRMDLWLNPSSTTLGTSYSAIATTGVGITSGVDTFAITALGSGSTVMWDNLRVGTTQADVLDVYATSQVPEPSAFAAIAGLGVLGLAATRRRRSAV